MSRCMCVFFVKFDRYWKNEATSSILFSLYLGHPYSSRRRNLLFWQSFSFLIVASWTVEPNVQKGHIIFSHRFLLTVSQKCPDMVQVQPYLFPRLRIFQKYANFLSCRSLSFIGHLICFFDRNSAPIIFLKQENFSYKLTTIKKVCATEYQRLVI